VKGLNRLNVSTMAADFHGEAESSIDLEDLPEYLKEVTNAKFLNISIKGYEKKTSTSGFSKDEYYAYRVISMLVLLLVINI